MITVNQAVSVRPRGGMQDMGGRTFLDGAFAEEGSWMPRLLMTYGFIAIALFFLPMYVSEDHTETAFQILGKKGVSGWVKLMYASLPLVGVVFIILKVVQADKKLVGIILILAVFPAVGFLAAVDDELPRRVATALVWRMGFFWLCLTGTVYGLMFFGSRPRDPLSKALLGVFSGMLALNYLLPVSDLQGQDTIWIAFVIKGMRDVDKGMVFLVVMSLVPLFLALGSLWFLTPGAGGERRRVFAQNHALITGLWPAFMAVVGFFVLAVKAEDPGRVMSGIWLGLYFSYCFLIPALGATLLTLGVRRRGVH